MLVGVISEQNKLFRNWGACVDTVFLTRVKEGDFCEGKVGFGRNQKMHRVGIGRWSSSDGPEEYALKMLIR